MNYSARLLLIVLTQVSVVFTSAFAFSESHDSPPEWISNIPTDSAYYFSVGVGEAANESEAREAADKQAVNALFETVFGVRYTAKSESESSLHSSNLIHSSKTEIDLEFIDKLERTSSFVKNSNDGKRIAYQLVRISKSDADARRKASENFNRSNRPGHLIITSNPEGAEVAIDGAAHGVTPLNLTLVPGKYQLRISKLGFKDYKTNVHVRRVEKVSIKASLEAKSGHITVISPTKGAHLEIDGNLIPGTSPWRRTLAEGPHQIVVRAKGYNRGEEDFVLQGNEEKEVVVVLKKKQSIHHKVAAIEDTNNVEESARELLRASKWPDLMDFSQKHRSKKGFTRNSYFYEALALTELNLFSEAEATVKQAIRLKDSALHHGLLCRIYNGLSKYEKAVAECDRATLMDPHNASFLLFKARVFRKHLEERHWVSSKLKRQMIDAYTAAAKQEPAALGELESLCQSNYYLRGTCRN